MDINFFSRVEVFKGEHANFRDWILNINTIIGQIDQKLGSALKEMIAGDNLRKVGDLEPEHHQKVPRELKEESSMELFLWVDRSNKWGGDAEEMCTAVERELGAVERFHMMVRMNERYDPMTIYIYRYTCHECHRH